MTRKSAFCWELGVLFLGLCCAAGAEQPVWAAAPPTPAASASAVVQGLDPELGAEVQKWIEARVANAKKGQRELVRVPLTRRSDGWGCSCPDYYIGIDPTTHDDDAKTWVEPVLSQSAELPEPDAPRKSEEEFPGYVVTIEGYFTGKIKRLDLRGRGGPKEWLYKLWDLQVLRVRRESSTRAERSLKIVLSGAEAQREVPPLRDDRPWLVIGGDAPLFDDRSQQQADELKKKLQAAGFAKTEVLDSRQAPNLFCCHRIVLVDRFKTRAEAQAAAADARLKPFAPYVRRGF